MIKNIIKSAITLAVVLVVFSMLYHTTKPMPEGTSILGTEYNISEEDIELLYDLTYTAENGSRIVEQEIFRNVFDVINQSERFIVIDMFLFNTDYAGKEKLIPITTEMKKRLIEKKTTNPAMNITFITDEINNFYGSYESEHLAEMKAVGINVIITDLGKLRDSNPAYSSFWRIFLQPFGQSGEGRLRHPLGNLQHNVTLRSWMKLLNTKANHRKVLIADNNNTVVSIVMSANPHDASSLHSNIALLIRSQIWKDMIAAESSIAKLSAGHIPLQDTQFVENRKTGDIQVQILTESKIKKSMIEDIENTDANDSIDIAMFYISDRDVVDALLKASTRGVSVRLILDPNKDAFAREKNGIPNRQVAYELVKKSEGKIRIKWYDTQGEQFHTKTVIIRKGGMTIIYIGSANLTRRNIGDLNIEADIRVNAPKSSNISHEIETYFSRIWDDKNANYTIEFDEYLDDSKAKIFIYKFQEGSGLSSF